jgi:hypothetical protein
VIGAERYERSDVRTNWRNGARDPLLATKAGDVELKFRKLRRQLLPVDPGAAPMDQDAPVRTGVGGKPDPRPRATARSLARPDVSPRLVRRWSRRPADRAGVGRRRSGRVPCLPACPRCRPSWTASPWRICRPARRRGDRRRSPDLRCRAGNEVVGCRDRHTEIGVVPQTNHVPGGRAHQIPGGVVEAPRPLEPGLRLCPVDAPRGVDHVATADDEHPSVAQRRQLGAQLEVVVERLLHI